MPSRTMLARSSADPIKFIENVLIDFETGKPFVLLDSERNFLKHAFSMGPDGRLLYPELGSKPINFGAQAKQS